MGNELDSFKQALRAIVQSYGPEIFRDRRRTEALLSDYAPKQAKERKLIAAALNEGVAIELIKAREMNRENRQWCVKTLVDEAWMADDAARLAVEIIADSLGMSGFGTAAPVEKKERRDPVVKSVDPASEQRPADSQRMEQARKRLQQYREQLHAADQERDNLLRLEAERRARQNPLSREALLAQGVPRSRIEQAERICRACRRQAGWDVRSCSGCAMPQALLRP